MPAKIMMAMSSYKDLEWLKNVSVKSILNQDYEDWKLFLTHDGECWEADEIGRWIESLKDRRIVYNIVPRVLPDPPFEVGSPMWRVAGYQAVNFGLDLIKKENPNAYVLHCDTDDFWKTHHISLLKNFLDDNKYKTNFVYSKAAWFAQNHYICNIPNDAEFSAEKMMQENYIAHSTIGYRLKSPHQLHYSGETDMPSDWRHHKSFLECGKPFICTNDISVLYFQRCTVGFATAIIDMIEKGKWNAPFA